MVLFCFPYAGGSAAYYYSWEKFINRTIKVYPVELAGHGKRFDELHYSSLDVAINDLYEIIEKNINYDDYALFGHSMGSHLAYYVAQKVISEGKKTPKHIFFSGLYPPYIIKDEKIIHTLPDEEFIKEIIALGGIPNELKMRKELLKVFIPILKSDYKLMGNRNIKRFRENNKFECDITIFSGINDEKVPFNDIQHWGESTTGRFEHYQFIGGHFFINNHFPEIIQIINKTLDYKEQTQ